MQKKINTKGKFMRRTSQIMVAASGIFLMVMLLSNASGPAKNGNYVTGAPFNKGLTCAKSGCHSGGNFGAAISTQLLNASNVAVTSYSPGQPYTLRISMSKTTGTPKYGFQTTCATAANVGVNSWGTPPTGTHAKTKTGHTYVEHSKALKSGVILIPWTAPAKGTGSVIFYTSGNEVNGNGSTTGDQPVNNSLTIAEGVAPSSPVASLNAVMQNNQAVVTFKPSGLALKSDMLLEKSADAVNFSVVDKVSSANGNYSYKDKNPDTKAFYRLKITNEDGSVMYSNVASVVVPSKLSNQLSLYSHAGAGYIMFHNDGLQQSVQVIYSDISGNVIYNETRTVNAGDNSWSIPRDKVKGMAIVNVVTKDGNKSSMKIGLN